MTFIFYGKKINNVISNRLEVGLISLNWSQPSYLLLISLCQAGRRQYQIKWKFYSRAGLVIYGIPGSYGDGLTGWRADGLSNCLQSLASLAQPGGLLAVIVKKLMRQHFVGKPRYQARSLTEPPTSFLSVVDDWILTNYLPSHIKRLGNHKYYAVWYYQNVNRAIMYMHSVCTYRHYL